MLNADEIARLAAIVPPPVGTLDVSGDWLLTFGTAGSPWQNIRFVNLWHAHHLHELDPLCHAWQGAMQAWLDALGTGTSIGRVNLEGDSPAWIAMFAVGGAGIAIRADANTAAEARARLVLAVAAKVVGDG